MLDISYIQLSRYLRMKFTKAEEEDPSIAVVQEGDLNTANVRTSLGIPLIDIPATHIKAIELISDIYSKLQISDLTYITGSTIKDTQVGDIVIVYNHKSRKNYVVCIVSNDSSGVSTWPEVPIGMLNHVSSVYRINTANIDKEKLKQIHSEIGLTIEEFNKKESLGKIIPNTIIKEGLLQIGDIKFLVTPTQISFVTQNGYEYFPTIRTAGNPKIPTLQEVKSININLIFPNTDTINNQLLPLFAMYKRSPFVPLYNKDICEFFREIRENNSQYIPVALDSISVESVKGFPNTLQASINILPFQHKGVGETFQALESYEDVKAQQFIEDDRSLDIIEKQLEDRLSGNPQNSLHAIKNPQVNHTYNFEKSEPFRAYYQAMIGDRNYVEDDLGNVVIKTDGKKIPLSIFRPTREQNKLRYYLPDANKGIKFNYTYISEEFRAFSKKLSEERFAAQAQIAESTKYMMKILFDTDSPEFTNKLHTRLYNRQDFFDNIRQKFSNNANSFIEHFLGRYGINMYIEPAPRITGLLGFMIQYAGFQFPNASFIAGKLGGSLIDTESASSTNSFFNAAGKLLGGNFEFTGIEDIDLMHGTVVQYNSGDEGETTVNLTLKEATNLVAKKISESLNKAVTTEEAKMQWAAFFEFVLDMFAGPEQSLVDKHSLPFKTSFLPIEETSIVIDGQQDTIEGWGLNFSNKFVPMNLQGHKYPYYQHIGSEDINLSLSITSLQQGRLEGLKEQFSLLNDRLYNSAKIVLHQAPELINSLDPRLIADVPDGNILKVFGLQKVVYNSSNVSSMAGNPNAWAITVSLTQANIDVKDYQSVTEIGNNSDIEDRIINYISRMGIDEDGQVVIYNYLIDYEKIKTKAREDAGKIIANQDIEYTQSMERAIERIEESKLKTAIIGDPRISSIFGGSSTHPVEGANLRELNVVLMDISFYIDTSLRLMNEMNYIKETDKEMSLEKTLTPFRYDHYIGPMGAVYRDDDPLKDIPDTERNAIINNIKLFELGYIQRKISSSETRDFKELFKNQNTRLIILNLIQRQSQLKRTQADLYINMFKKHKSMFERWIGSSLSVDNMLTILSAAVIGGVGIGIEFIPSGITQALGAILITMANGMLLTTGVVISANTIFGGKLDKEIAKRFDQVAASANAIINGMKYSFVGQMAQQIIRDPVIRKKLFGDIYEESISKSLMSSHSNCYKDFDIPPVFTTNNNQYGSTDIRFSPDFYLYNKDISKIEKLSYSESTIKRMITIGRIASLLSLQENHRTLKDLEKEQDILFNRTPDNEKENILKEFRLLSNAGQGNSKEYVGDPSHEDFIKDRVIEIEKVYTHMVLGNKTRLKELSPDVLKINLIQSARAKRIVELKNMQVAIDVALGGSKDVETNSTASVSITLPSFGQGNKDKFTNGTIYDASFDSLKRIKESIDMFFGNHFHTTEAIEKEVSAHRKVSLPNDKFHKQYLSQPNIRRFEEVSQTLLNQIIILSHAIQDYFEGATEFQDLDTIPELAMLSWWNWRNTEDQLHQIGLQKDFIDEDNSKTRGFNSKMYPTFKIFFVEEDSRLLRSFDDYYSYDAIQSIDIVSNKYSAGKVATITLSNSMGNLTNKFSLMREKSSLWEKLIDPSDDIFLGNLDIKPGTKIIIKVGYAANDRFLKTHFVGRIIEMTPGPTVRMVCQSYGAQLNHEIVKMHFGILSTSKEHGDIATAIMDAVPSLEGLGKPALLGLNASKFSGKNIKGIDKHLFEKFLLSNVTSRVNAGMFAQDNPRDDNIYLPYNMIADITHRPTFDWIVYNQTVWQALNEISLYHRNTYPIVKMYNSDFLSSMQDIRETIVMGNKSGYYRYTDSFSLSTMDIKGIQETVDNWNAPGGIREALVKVVTGSNITRNPLTGSYSLNGLIPYMKEVTEYHKYYYPQDKDLKKIMVFFSNKRNATVILYKLLESMEYAVPMSIGNLSLEYIQNKFKGLPGTVTKYEKLIKHLMSIASMGEITDRAAEDYVVSVKEASRGPDTVYSWDQKSIKPIVKLLYTFKSLLDETISSSNSSLYNLKTEDFLHVEPFETDNTKDKFANDPRYHKIQNHHLITDQSDILSNNIVLSQDFNNAISIYYLWEPKFYDGLSGISKKDISNLQSFTIKAFGDIRDKDIRLLETYQKNVDTNWWDIRDKSQSMLNSYLKKYDPQLKYNEPTWKELPAFVVVGVSMLQREIEKMYRGTIQIVGNPSIEPMDILHIEDYLNDMHGTVEVEEVVHSFSPSEGFITTITPSMIAYDRDPRAMYDVSVVRNIINTADLKRSQERVLALLKGAGSIIGFGLSYNKFSKGNFLGKSGKASIGSKIFGGAGMAFSAFEFLSSVWGGTIAAEKKYTKFVYDSMCNVFGRDCINFSTLLYHGSPYMCGFDGIDYTSINTMINHQIKGLPPITRLAAANDPQRLWISKHGDLGNLTNKEKMANIFLPGGNFLTDFLLDLGFEDNL